MSPYRVIEFVNGKSTTGGPWDPPVELLLRCGSGDRPQPAREQQRCGDRHERSSHQERPQRRGETVARRGADPDAE